MKLSKKARQISRQLYQASFTNGLLDEAKVRGFVNSIAESKPRGFFEILQAYSRLIRLAIEKRHARIESATPLNSQVADSLLNELRQKYGADLTSEFVVVPELIGGVRVKIGDDVWDGSVLDRITRLQEALLQ